MKITFLIGNGFDINLGMDTRYTDVYEKYVGTPSKNNNIELFKEELKTDRFNKYTHWSDFEMAMAKYAEEFQSESDFLECVRDFKEYMIKHIESEEIAFVESKEMYLYREWLYKVVNNFYKGLNPNSSRIIDGMLQENEDYANVNFIVFNYTSILDYIIELYTNYYDRPDKELNMPIHIHGRLNADVILGVDNIKQFGNIKFELSRKGQRSFIKPMINEAYDNTRVNQTLSEIGSSSVVCVYGLALGDSDESWRNVLKAWLLSSKDKHLIYNYYDTKTYSRHHPEDILEQEEIYREEILKKLGFSDDEITRVERQVHIPVGHNIFDLKDKV